MMGMWQFLKLTFLIITASMLFAFGSAYGATIMNGEIAGNVSLLDHGGPDSLGYYFIDSHENSPGAPIYNWKEISGSGVDMNITDDDQSVGPFPIGFRFKYYSIQYDSFQVCSNGFFSFTSNSEEYINDPIPDTHEPNNIMAVFWDDLEPDSTSHAYYYSNHRDSLIVEWKNFKHLSHPGIYTFEAILTSNCDIIYQYYSVSGTLDSHTIGIENRSGTVGLEYVFNVQEDESGSAIRFTRGMNSILVLAAEGRGDFGNYISNYDDIARVDYIDVRNQTPSLSDLEQYDAICVWSDSVINDPIALGNVLADYLDIGGAVVLFQFCFAYGWELQGRIMNDYSPFTVGDGVGNDSTLGSRDAGHPIMANVNFIRAGGLPGNVALAHSPVLVASFSDGTPMVAYNPRNNLVGMNIFVGNRHRYSGDVIEMCHNAIEFAIDGPAQMLIVASDTQGAPRVKWELRQFSDIHSAHIYDASRAAPSLSLLNLYSAVDVWPNGVFFDRQLLGDRLADYADAGGGVVLHQYCFESSQLLGRIMSDYCPFAPGTNQNQLTTLGDYNQFHPLMQGVVDITDYLSAHVTLLNGGVQVASWDDSTGFVAYNPNHPVVAINGYIGYNRRFTGDMMTLTHNAINFVRRQTGIEDRRSKLPDLVQLAQNYPNPFNPTTTIMYDLPAKSEVLLEVFNLLGERVRTLPQGVIQAGHHEVAFDAKGLTSGVYFYKLTAGKQVKTKKMVVLK
jgi:hypothetical protein